MKPHQTYPALHPSMIALIMELVSCMRLILCGRKQLERAVPGFPGLRVIVFASGAVKFYIQFRAPDTGRKVHMLIGDGLSDSFTKVITEYSTMRAAISEGQNPRASQITVSEFFRKDVTPIRKTLSSWKDSESRFRLHIEPVIGAMRVCDVKPRHLQAIVDKVAQKHSYPLANRVRAEIMAIFRVAEEQEFVSRSPASHLRGYPENPPRQREPSADELAALCASALADKDRHAGLLLVFLNMVPLRIGEALGLRWDDLNLDSPTPSLTVRHTKNKRPHCLPLTPEVIAVVEKLAAIRRGQFVFPSQDGTTPKPRPDSAFRRICERADASGITWHDFRRGWCSRACRAGVPIEIASAMLNHSDISVTAKHYRVVNLPEMARAAQLVNDASAGLTLPVEG